MGLVEEEIYQQGHIFLFDIYRSASTAAIVERSGFLVLSKGFLYQFFYKTVANIF